MTAVEPVEPVTTLPIACRLTPNDGRQQLERWREFNATQLVGVERGAGRLVARYRKSDDNTVRLRALVAVERECCTFVDWAVDDTGDELRLTVTGGQEQLAALAGLVGQ